MDKGIIVHALLFNENKEALLIRRSSNDIVLPGIWDIPGGTLDDGEDPEQGAIRETKEETGLDVKNLSLLYYTSNVDLKKNKQFIRLIFVGTCTNPNVILNQADHDQYRWISVDRAYSDMKMVEYLPSLFKNLKEKRSAINLS